MKWIVEYNPEIKERLIEELDENYEVVKKLNATGDFEPKFNRNKILVLGKIITITEALKDKVREKIRDGMLFKHEVVEEGKQMIEFKSYIDILPEVVKDRFKGLLEKKIIRPLKKVFGSDIYGIKEVK